MGDAVDVDPTSGESVAIKAWTRRNRSAPAPARVTLSLSPCMATAARRGAGLTSRSARLGARTQACGVSSRVAARPGGLAWCSGIRVEEAGSMSPCRARLRLGGRRASAVGGGDLAGGSLHRAGIIGLARSGGLGYDPAHGRLESHVDMRSASSGRMLTRSIETTRGDQVLVPPGGRRERRLGALRDLRSEATHRRTARCAPRAAATERAHRRSDLPSRGLSETGPRCTEHPADAIDNG